MQIHEKIKAIRQAEGLTQVQLSDLSGVPRSTINKLDAGINSNMKAETLQKIAGLPEFEKYALWLLTDKTDPENGQISPAIKAYAEKNKIKCWVTAGKVFLRWFR